MNLCKTSFLKSFWRNCNCSSVNRSENNFDIFFSFLRKTSVCYTSLNKSFVNFFSNICQQCIVSLKFNFFNFHIIYFVDNFSILRRNNLRSIIPINFVTIVNWRIMRSRQHNSCITTQMTNCKRQFWGWTERFEQINIDSIRS